SRCWKWIDDARIEKKACSRFPTVKVSNVVRRRTIVLASKNVIARLKRYRTTGNCYFSPSAVEFSTCTRWDHDSTAYKAGIRGPGRSYVSHPQTDSVRVGKPISVFIKPRHIRDLNRSRDSE